MLTIFNDTARDEEFRQINPYGVPNRHDILTGATSRRHIYVAHLRQLFQ